MTTIGRPADWLRRRLRREDTGAPARVAAGGAVYSPELHELFREVLRPGMVVVDVGAHHGLFTQLAAALVGPSGRVWAFEPAPANFRVLRAAVRAFPQVVPVQAALSDRHGEAWLTLDRDNSTQHSLEASNVGTRARRRRVRALTLVEALPADLDRLDLIKIDAQGFDGAVLKGARALLKRHHPRVVFELWPAGWRAAGYEPDAVLASLASLDYALFKLSAKGGRRPEDRVRRFLAVAGADRWRSINVLAEHQPGHRRRAASVEE